MIKRAGKEDEITIVGTAFYENGAPYTTDATIGVLDGQFLILLFPVCPAVIPLLKNAKPDTLDKYLIEEHVKQLAVDNVAEPIIDILSEAFDIADDADWSVNFGYLADLNPPKRYATIYPPKGEIQPFEYVTKILTQAREKGPVMRLRFSPDGVEAEDGEDEEG